jgi:hypothetical protein
MKRITIISAIILWVFKVAQAQDTRMTAVPDNTPVKPSFDQYFENKVLRVDYMIGGNSQEEHVFLSAMKQEPYYGGPHKNLLDTGNSGTYRYAVYDSATGSLIYSKGFCTLFQEWKGTPEALKVRRVFPMSAVMPFPKNSVIFTIDIRDYETGEFKNLFTTTINPKDYFINRENITVYKTTKFADNGDPANHLDIAFIAEGYKADEMKKFRDDAKRFADYFLSQKPYSEYKDKINFYTIESPSQEAGVDIPGNGTYVNTNINSSFYTFDMDRYLTSSDTKSMYDIAANAPWDQFIVLVNSSRYGGGGFYNHYCQGTVDHPLSLIVGIHEFGHAFGGLADEYYNSQVTYSDFYNLKVEPWEPNITTNIDFSSKWKSMVDPGVPVPTPRDAQYAGKVGMFEGGGYVSQGVYSPVMDCRMKSNEAQGFCPVCRKAITEKILFYCD